MASPTEDTAITPLLQTKESKKHSIFKDRNSIEAKERKRQRKLNTLNQKNAFP